MIGMIDQTILTWHIHIEGQVQGVGFRPYVYQKAIEYGLNGWVNNSADGVHIEFNADSNNANLFYKNIIKNVPRLARLTKHSLSKTTQKFFDNFQIIDSDNNTATNLLLTPDFAICNDCQTEWRTKSDRRLEYPYITCTNCGPRYSIVTDLPYDRPATSMDAFEMCPTCLAEYQNPLDRRYYSQTNSCLDCGIALKLYNQNQELISDDQNLIIEKILNAWADGKIVAIKGIGGFLITGDATNIKTIQEIRQRKHRPTKPLAVMIPRQLFHNQKTAFTKKEAELLNSEIAPIVLVNSATIPELNTTMSQLAPGINRLGVMLPYTPLFDILLEKFNRPIVATSGNISNQPIVFKNETALKTLSTIADFLVLDNRPIQIPQDDSVIQFTPLHQQRIIHRRSRGMAPTFIQKNNRHSSETIFAAGAMLKSSFAIQHEDNIYISQYLGDLENFETIQQYEFTVNHLSNLLKIKIAKVVSDSHPNYPSTHFANQLATEKNIPIIQVQHHLAHFAAILGEHDLLENNTDVLGFIWDGTGLGTDQEIWGGEVFSFFKKEFKRVGQVEYFDFILGNKMPKEPRISALSICKNIDEANKILEEKFTSTEWNIYQKLLSKPARLQTSSMGRLFDAVASILGILDKQCYEGEAAILLENKSRDFFIKQGYKFNDSYSTKTTTGIFPTTTIISKIIKDIIAQKSISYIGAKFHQTLVDYIAATANHLKIKNLAFSGGVFQNSLLVDLIIDRLDKDFNLFFHQELSPNDENISFGELMYTAVY